MKTNYPVAHNTDMLEQAREGSIFHLKGWGTSRFQDGTVAILDMGGGILRLSKPSQWLLDKFLNGAVALSGVDLYVQVLQNEDWIHPMIMLASVPVTEIRQYEPEPSPCNCGATHDRDFPNIHSEWCESHTWR